MEEVTAERDVLHSVVNEQGFDLGGWCDDAEVIEENVARMRNEFGSCLVHALTSEMQV